MISEERVIHLYAAYPNCHLQGEWDAAAFYFPADLLCSPHVCLPFFVDDDYSPCPLLIRECLGMHVI
jgi:hypothetical protein